ncbi:MAG: insulinase family protein [Candidatus Eisenbacteria sp.]|nr:insulinase family protein [Candidatus Eisenbacteria bacterium]
MFKTLMWPVCALLVTVTILAGAEAGMAEIFPYRINEEVLDNGLKVISIPYDSPGVVAFVTVARVGSRNEVEEGLSGFAHLFEHMMFRGTEKYPQLVYNDILDGMGADHSAFTTDDYTCYHILSSTENLARIIEIEADRFQNLKYTEDEFKTETGAVMGEYHKNNSMPFQMMEEKLHGAAYTTHTYKHTTMGFLRDIEDMPNQHEYSLEFHSRWYRPENCVVLVVGDFDQGELLKAMKKHWGSWERRDFRCEIPREPPQTGEKRVEVQWPTRTLPYLYIGYHAPAFDDRSGEMPALDLLSQMVFSQTSPLFQELVIEKQLVEFIFGGALDSRDPPLFTIMTRVKNEDDLPVVEQKIYEALENAKTELVDAQRLEAIKSHMRYRFALGLDTPHDVAMTMAHYLQLTADPQTINRVYDMYQSLSPEDIRRVANDYFGEANRTVLTLKYGGEG